MKQIKIENEEALESAAREFIDALSARRHVAFHGAMGAGKTTFISALCRVLGAEDEASSPTFSLVNEYVVGNGGAPLAGGDHSLPVYHFDFYRIETPEEAMDMGLDDYWDSGALCLMEWPENVEDFLPDDTLDVDISVLDDGTRLITF